MNKRDDKRMNLFVEATFWMHYPTVSMISMFLSNHPKKFEKHWKKNILLKNKMQIIFLLLTVSNLYWVTTYPSWIKYMNCKFWLMDSVILKLLFLSLFKSGQILQKFSPTWNDYRKKLLLYIAKNFMIEQILKYLRIVEESRKCDALFLNSKVNIYNENGSNKN